MSFFGWGSSASGGGVTDHGALTGLNDDDHPQYVMDADIGVTIQAYDAMLDQFAALSDPGADRIPFWDESANAIDWLTVGSGLSISGTTITATGTPSTEFGDDVFRINDDGDPTKQIAFQASGITTGTTRTLTVQDASGTIYISGGTDIPVADGGTGASNASGARTNLGLVIGTDVQAWDADLDTWAGKTAPSGTVVGHTDTQTLTNKTLDNTNTITLKDTLFTLQDDGDATKQARFQLSGITTGNTRTYTLPDASATLVGLATTQTLSNKTLDNTTTANLKDSIFTLEDDGDATKIGAFQLSGITTGNTRTVTWPNSSGTMYVTGGTDVAVADGGTGASDATTARSNLGLVIGTNVQAWDADLDTWAGKTAPSGTVVGHTDTQTLTNKTINGTTNTVEVQDSTFKIFDNSDTSKIAQFQCSGITTGTTRTYTFPNASTTLVGTDTTDTLSNKTLTAAKIASGGFLADANGNEQIIFTTTASAVNEFTFTNAATGNAPKIAATGGDTNINLDLDSKGTGVIRPQHAIVPKVVTLTDAATIAVDASLGNHFRVTLGGNRTLGNPTNAVDGQKLFFEIIQDGTGSRTLAYDTKFQFGADITAATVSTTASKADYLGVVYNSSADKFRVIAFVKGYG